MANQDVTLASEAARAPTPALLQARQTVPEAARAPSTAVTSAAVTGTWLNPGFPESTVRFGLQGTVEYSGGPPHGLAAAVGGGQLLLFFHHRGDARFAVPHLLRPVTQDAAPLAWRTHDRKEVLVLPAPLAEGAVPSLASHGEKHGLWVVPGHAPGRAHLARGGEAAVAGASAWWGMAKSQAASAAHQQVLVLLLPTPHGDEPVVLRPLSEGVWRCSAKRCVFLEDGAPQPRLQPSDLPRFVPRDRLQHGLLWLHPGRAPQTVSLTFDRRVAWAAVGGATSGPANGKWENFQDDAGQYLAVNFHAFGEETKLKSTVFKLLGQNPAAWHTVGTVAPQGALQFLAPEALANWHVLALVAQLPAERPAM